MMADEPKIEPRTEGGVPWCDAECGSWQGSTIFYCLVDGENNDLCHPAIKQMAKRIAELEATHKPFVEAAALMKCFGGDATQNGVWASDGEIRLTVAHFRALEAVIARKADAT